MKKNGPWTIKSSEIKYKNQWIEVSEDQVIRPDGKDGAFGVIRMVAGVSVLPIDNEGNAYLLDEFKYAIGRRTIACASGGVEANETGLKAAQRELKEELGIEGSEWTDLGSVDPFTSVIQSSARIFLVRDLTFSETAHEGTESITLVKVPFQEVVQKVMESVITHSPSCVLILKAARILEKEGV